MGSAASAVWLVVVGILSVQFGAAIAKDLFDEVTPTALVWLRLATSAVFLALIARPVLSGRTRHDWVVVLGFGLSLGTMNWAIYQSFARIPLGVAVTIEFVGPLVLAAVGSHRARDLVWVVLAAAGVILLGAEPGRGDLGGRAVRAARRRRVGGVHPAEREHRPPLARPRRARGGQRRGRPPVAAVRRRGRRRRVCSTPGSWPSVRWSDCSARSSPTAWSSPRCAGCRRPRSAS